MKKKRIGILGGISYQSTIEYYRLIMEKYFEKFQDYYSPEIVIFNLDFQKFTDFENNDKENYINYIMEGINSLKNAGVDFIIMAANSPHAVFDEIKEKNKIPMISIAEVTADKAKKLGLKKLLLLGIKFTMQSSFYKEVCNKRNIEVIVPDESEQDEINRIIFKELCSGLFREESKIKLFNIINRYDVGGVILGCTELPLLLKQEASNRRLLNTLELHAEAALNSALNSV
ncbi:amino acid racemase [Candidatus Pacearchaeota archaeon]|nr:amino acid racemase [Candidatus Pacearchaeota archaeon]MBD3283232.1 amino acid racemase [Candidatus Pacearchaeota archaeon]